jgi:transcriptional regulator with XRE-family HTH domain
MDPVRLGRQYRALRHRQRLRQDDLSDRTGLSRSEIGRAERGQAERLRLSTLDRMAIALGARLEVRLSWNGEALDRLLDAAHAARVEQVVGRLTAAGWECAVEASFNIRGERGSVDAIAFHRQSGTLVVIEVKSVVPDVQATLMTLDRKARLGPWIASGLGWQTRAVGRVLAVAESRTSRRRVELHAASFAAALPDRTVAVKAWLRHPAGKPVIRGLWFLSSDHRPAARHRVPAPQAEAERPSRSKSNGGSRKICQPTGRRPVDETGMTNGRAESG